jgi:tetratricopeptide (TPR) repeat protein
VTLLLRRQAAAVCCLIAVTLLSGCSHGEKETPKAGDRGASSWAIAAAEEAVRSGRLADAEAAWNRAIMVDPSNPEPYASRGRAYWGLRRFRDAAEDFARASERDPKNADIILAEIQVRQDGGDETKTEALARRAVELQPENPKALVYLGRYLARLSDKPGAQQEARQLLEKAVRLAPTMPIPYVELGCLLQRQGEAALAETYLTAAWEMLHKEGRTLRQLESMSVVEARRAETAYALAQCKRAQGQAGEAGSWLARFRAVDARIEKRSRLAPKAEKQPPDLEALLELARMDIETGGAQEAVPLVRRAEQQAPADPRVKGVIRRLQSIPSTP